MRVILLTDVSKLGKKGDLIDVAEGYGRNYLIPRKMAEEATREKLKEWEQQQKTREARARREEEEAWASRALLQGKQVVLKVPAGEKGKLFVVSRRPRWRNRSRKDLAPPSTKGMSDSLRR